MHKRGALAPAIRIVTKNKYGRTIDFQQKVFYNEFTSILAASTKAKVRRQVMKFLNEDELLGGGEAIRNDALRIIQAGIERVIPYDAVKRLIVWDGHILQIGEKEIHLDEEGDIYVVGAGKGSFPMAQALDEIFGERIKKGFVAVKEGEKRRLKYIEIFESSHPIPDERSITAARRIKEILDLAGEKDLIFAAITGGSSALVNMPADGISLDDLENINGQLLKCGAAIGKINAVRKHICLMKGGRVVQYGQPARVITLTFDTAPPDMPWPDMCLPDPTSFEEAINVLKTYNLWDDTPESIRSYLEKGLEHPELETVKTLEGMNQAVYSVADPSLACQAAADRAQELGYEAHILSTTLEGEAKDAGIFFAGLTDEILSNGRPFTAPCVLISGGETTVTIYGECGVGGPNQETALGFLNKVRHQDGYVCISIDTDGTDGPCDIAGGMVDGSMKRALKEKEINLNHSLRAHESSMVLKELGGAIYTGHTGTNVMNLRVVVIDGRLN